MDSNKKNRTTLYNLCVAGCSIVVSFCLIFAHEIWRDEGQAWLIARDTPLLQLISVLRHEGHPVFWYLVLMPFAKCGLPCIWMNYISWAFTAITVCLIAFKAPWHPAFKTVVLISPMFLYWIPVVARSYAPLNCLVLLAAYLYQKRKEHPILYGVLLFLMINTHVIIAGFVGAALLEYLYDIYTEWRETKKINKLGIAGFFIGVVGCLFMIFQLMGSPGTGDWNVSIIPDLSFIMNSIKQVMVIMFSTTRAWIVKSSAILLICVSLLIGGVLVWRKEWRLLLYYVFGSGFIWYILIFVLCSGNKMYMLYSIWLFVFWNMKKDKGRLFSEVATGIVLVYSMFIGYPNAILYDMKELYSAGGITAEYLNQISTEKDRIIFLDNSFQGAVTPYLKPESKVWDLTETGFWYYTVWSPERTQNNEILKNIYQIYGERDASGEIVHYTGSYMTDFFQNYIDQMFDEGTIVYLVLNEENAYYFDMEAEDQRRLTMGTFFGDCRYTGENYKIYGMISR